MSQDKIPIISEKKFTYEGIFDIKETYKILKDYLSKSRHYDVSEKDFDEKNDGANKKIMAKVEAEQEYTDYYKIIIKYEIFLEGKDVSVEIDNKTLKLSKGKAKLSVNAYVLADFQGIKPKGPISEFLEKVYNHYVGKSDFDNCAGSAAGDIDELMARFKQSVNATQF